MTRKLSHIQRESDKLRMEPPRSAWMRLEAQLGAHDARRRMRRARFISIAASILVIVSVGFLGYYFTNMQGSYSSEIYSHRLEPLVVDPEAGSSIYDVAKVKDLSTTWGN